MTTIVVTDSYTLKSGHELDFNDENGFELAGASTSSPSLTVAGTLKVTNSDAGFIQGVHVDEGVGLGTITIQKSGVVQVTATGECSAQAAAMFSETDVSNAGQVEIQAQDASAEAFSFVAGGSLTNTGSVTVVSQATASVAHGTINLANYGDMSADGLYGIGWDITGSVWNEGTLTVTGENSAIGATIFGDFHNSGDITVHFAGSRETAGVVFWTDGNALVNQGRIVVDAPNAISSHAIEIQPNHPGPVQVVENSGLLQAEWAFWTTSEVAESSSIVLNNSGSMLGMVQLSSDDDELHNSGKIVGAVLMGMGDDLYDTSGKGRQSGGAVFGEGGNDILTGGKVAEALFGDSDVSSGDDGGDTLTGAGGADTLTGGGGSDHFVFEKLTDSSIAKADLITDLEGSDVIDLHRIDADVTRDGNQTFHLVAKLTGHAGEAALVYDASHDVTRLMLDVDGDRKADALILISGDHTDFSTFLL